MTYIEGNGLLLPPADPPAGLGPVDAVRWQLAAAVTAAEAWLLDQGMSPADVAQADLTGRTRMAWWHHEAGFVQERHDGARQVIVVALTLPAAARPAGRAQPISAARER